MTSSHNITKRTAATAVAPIAGYVESVPIASTPINLTLFVIGAIITIYAYSSLSPILAAGVFYGVTYLLLLLPVLGGVYERNIFTRIFAVGFVMAGVAAIYANHFQDEGQLYSDASSFFEMAVGHARGLSLNDLKAVHEGSLAIVVWGAIYDFFAALGFPRERYIGITVNVTAVALAGVIGIKMIRQVFGNDDYRFRRLTLLVSVCGTFWLFAGIHLRDSVVLLAVTALAYAWLSFLEKPDFGWHLAQVLALSLLAFAFFGYLREAFVFVPVAMALATVAALYVGRVERRRRLVVYGLMLLGAVVAAFLYTTFNEQIQFELDLGKTFYGEEAADQHGSDSLGMALIVNQPMPIRLILGSIYLYVFPIPAWSGFQLESAYHLFKSANVIYFYFVLPLLFIAVLQIYKKKSLRTPALLFMLFLSVGFTMAIAATTLETRHFGAFLMPILVLSTLPDLREVRVWSRYKTYLLIILSGVVIVHAAWVALKLL